MSPTRCLLVILLCCFWQAVKSLILEDRLCSLYTFVPFTNNGSSASSVWGEAGNYNPGFHHMASALMAMEQFNTRDTTVVPELANFTNCNVLFDMNSSIFFDTETIGHAASQSLHSAQNDPCAIAGPFNDQPGLELSAMAAAAKFPLVAHRAFNLRLATEDFHPYSSQIYPDMFSDSMSLISFLLEKERNNFISFLYALTDTGMQRQETLGLVFDFFQIRYASFPYFSLPEGITGELTSRDIRPAMERMKDNGFRTVVVAMDSPFVEMPAIAAAAEELQMNNGEYFFVWFGLFEPLHLIIPNENITKLLAGSAWLSPIEESLLRRDTLSPFLRSWKSQGPDFVDRLNDVNPIEPDEPGYVFAEPTFFQEVEPDFGSGFMFDSVMSIGIGACLADEQNNDSIIEGMDHVNGIRSVDFLGASGRVRIADGEALHARLLNTVTFAGFNLLPPPADGEEQALTRIADALIPGTGGWTEFEPFVYADGRTVPPDLLRDTPEQNYLSSALRAFGLALMSIALFTACLAALWVFMHRKHAVLKASQPPFLYALALGSAVTASSILCISFDESFGWSTDQLNAGCMTFPWLICIGHIITYGALFSKLWRVNRVLQFSRHRVGFRRVLWPSALLFLGAIVILTVWTIIDPLRWTRKELDEETGESIGECACDHFWAYMAPLMTILALTTLMAAFMAWKTKDVADAYSESKWIFILISVQLEVMFVATPIIIILYDTSSDGRYLGFVLTIWIFAMSTPLLIMIPKVIAYHKAMRGIDCRRPKRGERVHGRVTGMAPPHNQTKPTAGEKMETEDSGDSPVE